MNIDPSRIEIVVNTKRIEKVSEKKSSLFSYDFPSQFVVYCCEYCRRMFYELITEGGISICQGCYDEEQTTVNTMNRVLDYVINEGLTQQNIRSKTDLSRVIHSMLIGTNIAYNLISSAYNHDIEIRLKGIIGIKTIYSSRTLDRHYFLD